MLAAVVIVVPPAPAGGVIIPCPPGSGFGKGLDYEALGITEYRRFDETGEHHKTRLAGDRLVDGRYEPITIGELSDGLLQGYSAALNLHLRWDHGRLTWHDPATGQHIATFESERDRADSERDQAGSAEDRIRELEEENRRLRGG